MITKRNGNGQTECYGCKEKGKFALKWDSWLYNFDNKPYCFECLMEELEKLQKENKELRIQVSSREEVANKYKEIIDKAINDLNIIIDIVREQPLGDCWIINRLEGNKSILNEVK